MSQLDEQLKTTLRDKADEMRLSPEMPARLRSRSRRRRLLNTCLTFAVVGAVALGSYVNLQFALDERGGPRLVTPAGRGDSLEFEPQYTIILREQTTVTRVAQLLVSQANLRFRPENQSLRIELEEGDNPPITTRITSTEDLEVEVQELRDKVFPDSEINLHPEGGSRDIRIVLGTDFEAAHSHELAAVSLVEEFMRHRYLQVGAEDFLSPEALSSYDAQENGLSLYGYTRAPGPFRPSVQYTITQFAPQAVRTEVTVLIESQALEEGSIIETLAVAPDDSDATASNIWIAEAKREVG